MYVIVLVVMLQFPGGLEDVPYTFVDTEEQLEQMLTELKESKEFAVDLEVRWNHWHY